MFKKPRFKALKIDIMRGEGIRPQMIMWSHGIFQQDCTIFLKQLSRFLGVDSTNNVDGFFIIQFWFVLQLGLSYFLKFIK